MSPIEVYDIQISAMCDLCEAGEQDYPNRGLGSFDFCPLEGGHRYVLVDRVDGGQPFAIHSADSLDSLQEFAAITETKDGKRVEWEIWRIVDDVVEPEGGSPICGAVSDYLCDLLMLNAYLEVLRTSPDAFERVVRLMAVV